MLNQSLATLTPTARPKNKLGRRLALTGSVALALVLAMTPATVATAAPSPSSDNVSVGALSFKTEQKVISYTPADLTTHTVFRPEKVHGKLPVVVWENGGCSTNNTIERTYLERVAASGFLVVAKGAKDAPPDLNNQLEVGDKSDVLWPSADTPLPAPAPAPGTADSVFPRTAVAGTVALMKSAIDWAESAEDQKGGDLYNHIDLEKIAATGWSCGGYTAMATAVADSRVDSVLGFNTASSPFVGQPQPTREDLLKLNIPIAWIMGGPGDIAYPGMQADWKMPLTAPMFQAQHSHLIHQLGWSAKDSQLEFAEIAIHWLDLTLNGNRQAAEYILGDPCGFCDNPNWTTESKNWESFRR
jgi:dienelactone hydrolase